MNELNGVEKALSTPTRHKAILEPKKKKKLKPGGKHGTN
jgi:hypothetical protein